MEIWKEIEWAADYEVSNLGRVRSWRGVGRKPTRLLAPNIRVLTPHSRGYRTVSISVGGRAKHHYVHRLVLEAFVGACPEGFECRHFPDRDKTNNALSNLSWGSTEQNAADRAVHGTARGGSMPGIVHPNHKLTDEGVRRILNRAETGESIRGLARELGVSQRAVQFVDRGQTWTHITLATDKQPTATPGTD